MEELMDFFKSFNKTKLVVPLTAVYFFVAFVEIIAESNKDVPLITMAKPLLMPLLLLMYWCASKKPDFLFVLGIFAAWGANLFLISSTMDMIFIGTVFFLLYRVLIILMVLRITKFPGFLPMVIGSLPFLFLYLFVSNLTYKELGERFFLFVVQGIFLILFGGFCLGSYILKSSKANSYLLVSTILFTAAQFITVLKIFYISYNIFQPLAMLCFIFGQYLLCLYLLIEEKKKRRYKQINSQNPKS
jgi:hypothetical protein